MGIPKKALRKSDLTFKTHGCVVSDSSHQTSKVSFVYENGEKVDGFYKELDKDYPPLLAKISVATSLFKRLFQGERSAEERLVFDEKDNLIGTVSIGLKDFKSFNFYEDEIPSDSSIKEQVIPSTQTLIEKNVMELLIGRWFLNDDDAHPHNQSLNGDIDFDMFFYWFTIWMKNPRMLVGVPNPGINLTVSDWENFPNVKDAKPYHWPTYLRPGEKTLQIYLPFGETILEKTLPKRYPAPEQFIGLASNEKAQEQKFLAALKALLTYQPDMVKNRLKELFGDLTLDYKCLDSNLAGKYEETFPQLCNAKTNTMPFVDFMLNEMYQKHYNNLYRVVVLYMGCENNKHGVRLLPTYEALYRKPSYYKIIRNWVKAQNETLYKKESSALQYNLMALEKRYHQVWRDSFALTLRDLWTDAFDLTNEVLGLATCNKTIGKVTEDKKPTDNDLTETMQLFAKITKLSKEKIEPFITVDSKSKIREALRLLIEFTNKLGEATLEYYNKERKELQEKDSSNFSSTLRQLYIEYDKLIYLQLAHETSFAKKFSRISGNLKHLMDQVDFSVHLINEDEHIEEKISSTKLELLPLNDEKLFAQFNKCLFEWAKSLKSEDFSKCILDIIQKHYAPSYINISRYREEPVKNYLAVSKADPGDNRLAYILGSGDVDTGALNKLLILHLTPLMLQTQNLPSIQSAIRDNTFKSNIEPYIQSAVKYAKTNPDIIHHFSTKGTQLFLETLFNWLDALPSPKFEGLIKSALVEYRKSTWRGTREKEVEDIQKMNQGQPAKIVALIFLGGKDSSSLNAALLCKIVVAIKDQIQTDYKKYKTASVKEKKEFEKYRNPGYRLINQFNENEHKEYYMEAIKTNPVTLKQSQNQESASFASTI